MYFSNIIGTVCNSSIFMVFLVLAVGLAIGSIKIRGLQIGDAGVFLAALVFGHFAMADDSLLHSIGLITAKASTIAANMKMVQNIGLACFVTSVGFIAGPKFFGNLKKNAKSYVLIAVVVIGLGAATCAAIIALTSVDSSMAVGILSGALTTTPGFSAAQDAALAKGLLISPEMSEYLYNEVTVGHGIGYPFGVLGVVIFVQLMPRLLRADMEKERRIYTQVEESMGRTVAAGNLKKLDAHGLFAFAAAITTGVLIGAVYIPLPGGARFSLTTTGGCLLMGLLFGYCGHIGKVSLKVENSSLVLFREFGLVLFLIGAGVPGGSGFVATLQEQGWMLFVWGMLMTLVPMIGGYLFTRYVLKMSLLNNLGAITGGMTSTPGLGALISAAGTDDVTSAYAATYPVALVFIVMLSQLIITIM